MKILFDHDTPRPLRRYLTEHTVHTADQMGWTSPSKLIDYELEHC